jgi:hypothetical protein
MFAALALAASFNAAPGPCRTVHGRMDLWNGAPSVRIWVIGTRRVLGVEQASESLDDLPPAVRRIWTGRDADWSTSIYGDFEVCTLTPERAGHMQRVRLIAARRLTLRPRQAPQSAGGGARPSTRAARPSA